MPESVIPQNIHLCLMGEDDAPPPELDAFTFLNRLRALGIGSADFLYLLKGCNAPEEAVQKIEENPAMNLQTLIVTLEGAGLKPRDYTRMLYTARQLWERTLTLRLDVDAELSDEETSDPPEQTDEPEVTEKVAAVSEAEKPNEAAEKLVKAQSDDISEETSDGLDEVDVAPAELSEDDREETEKHVDIDDIIATDDKSDDKSEPTVHRRSELDEDAPRVDTGTSVMTQIDPSKYILVDDDDEETDDPKPSEEKEEPKRSAYGRGGLIAAACGAAVLFGAAFTADYLGFEQIVEPEYIRHYAANNSEIFVEIYNAYNSGDYTADVLGCRSIGAEVFGNMLISLPEELGVFAVDSYVLSAEPDIISIYEKTEETLIRCGELLPPEGTQFFEILPREGGITCLFMGENSCGAVAYSGDGKQLFITEQVGVPTDIEIYDDRVNLATVYTPPFTESFTVDSTEHYLPYVEFGGEAELIPCERISLSGRGDGCSYAVWSSIKLSDGSLAVENTATLGRVVYSAAPEFCAVIDSAEGCYIVGDYNAVEDEFTEAPLAELTGCDMGGMAERTVPGEEGAAITEKQPIFATAEETAEGAVVYLRTFDYAPIAAITNINAEVTALSIKDDILYICGADGVLMAADISKPSEPVLLQLTAAEGVIKDDLALCSSMTTTGARLALYKRTEDGVSEVNSYTRELTAYERERFKMSGGNTVSIFAEDRCGAAYEFFDGVSFVTEFALFGKAKQQTTMFDESESFGMAHLTEDEIYLVYGDEVLKK